jgi:hypothetical protein
MFICHWYRSNVANLITLHLEPEIILLIFLLSVQSSSGAHQASYPVVPIGSFPGDKETSAYSHLHLVPRSRMMELYLHFPRRFHGMVLS